MKKNSSPLFEILKKHKDKGKPPKRPAFESRESNEVASRKKCIVMRLDTFIVAVVTVIVLCTTSFLMGRSAALDKKPPGTPPAGNQAQGRPLVIPVERPADARSEGSDPAPVQENEGGSAPAGLKYTVQAASYVKSEANLKNAEGAKEFLIEKGIPAFIRQSRKYIFLCVGEFGAAGSAAAKTTLDDIKAIEYLGSKQFKSAMLKELN